ncbi:pre-mrna-splicing factor cwc15 [Plasmopara halstedii]|uniref:Pre-mrna-splicing factor cwc15 n=1 Tax=Plasmopara halstedii TaxID=4781 RepID=A0A0N7L6C4_PLAHL|nr:pre-mrna-splicing factor cwc15 [Plasmopara halstedii]CEG43883.1 pre-mrna-splicing factor cwc15 [Plasmopara halstedii]|eukprot:XP_024580252.1 pre-mrna-splicing factor cwc15 [Plasmopara halstedii]
MTTAHRPTWHAAVGQSNEGGWHAGGKLSDQISARDLPAHRRLKLRQVGQGTANEVELMDLREELERKEEKYEVEKGRKINTAQDKLRRLEENKKILLLGDAETNERESQLKKVASKYDDADDGADSENSSDGDSDSDDDDEEAELMLELEKIKREREEERLRKEEEERKITEQRSREEILQGNPLTQQQAAGSAKMKRRWNDDVVFKNQSRNEPEVKKRFINDTIRNDFHRRFLSKYIQ